MKRILLLLSFVFAACAIAPTQPVTQPAMETTTTQPAATPAPADLTLVTYLTLDIHLLIHKDMVILHLISEVDILDLVRPHLPGKLHLVHPSLALDFLGLVQLWVILHLVPGKPLPLMLI